MPPEEAVPLKNVTVETAEKNIYGCPTCGKKLSTSSNLNQHKKIHLNTKSFICNTYQKPFGRK